MNLKRIIKATLKIIVVWKVRYCILHATIDVDLINNMISTISDKFPYKVSKLSFEDFLKGDEKYITEEKLKRYKNWLQDESRDPYGIIIGEDLAYSSWISYSKIEVSNKTTLLGFKDTALLQDDYCHTKYRQKGFHYYMTLYRLRLISRNGIKTAITIVNKNNSYALKAVKKATFKKLADIELFSFFGKEYIRTL